MVHLNNAALDNQPTEVIAKGLAAARLATPNGCRARAEQQFVSTSETAWSRTPDPEKAGSIPVHYGSCGEHLDRRRARLHRRRRHHRAPGAVRAVRPDAGPRPRPTATRSRATTRAGCPRCRRSPRGWPPSRRCPRGFRGLFKGLRGTGSSATRAGRLALRLRSVVVPWTAAVVLAVVAFVVVLVQVRDTLLHPANLEHSAVLIGVLAVVAVLRVTSDAFSSSLHPFYRERISETFLVKRESDEAVPLDYNDPTHVFTSFADSGPELTVCCAANVGDRDYIPAERGCAQLPLRHRRDRGRARCPPVASACPTPGCRSGRPSTPSPSPRPPTRRASTPRWPPRWPPAAPRSPRWWAGSTARSGPTGCCWRWPTRGWACGCRTPTACRRAARSPASRSVRCAGPGPGCGGRDRPGS